MEVHKSLGNGFPAVIYQRALAIERTDTGLPFSREHEMEIFCKGQEIGTRRVDFLFAETVMVELKAIVEIEDVHPAQALIYLEAYELEIGLLINYGAKSLQFTRVMRKRRLPSCLNQELQDYGIIGFSGGSSPRQAPISATHPTNSKSHPHPSI